MFEEKGIQNRKPVSKTFPVLSKIHMKTKETIPTIHLHTLRKEGHKVRVRKAASFVVEKSRILVARQKTSYTKYFGKCTEQMKIFEASESHVTLLD